jgi:hexosaminidase
MYGIESFSQLVESGGLINASVVNVTDAPRFEHRSFMVDTGRRFWPVKTVMTLLDAMAALKMNVLHLHLSDNCRYAFDSAKFPDLTKRLTGILAGSYSVSDVGDIVAYAADRGVRVIPEADLPGHSQVRE